MVYVGSTSRQSRCFVVSAAAQHAPWGNKGLQQKLFFLEKAPSFAIKYHYVMSQQLLLRGKYFTDQLYY